MMTSKKVLIGAMLIVGLLHLTSARWCTRLVRKHHMETELAVGQCTQSYKARCGWFSSQMCTYYELVECPVQQNRSVEKYEIVEECCPGYVLDPINNITCIKVNDELYQEEVTTNHSIIHEELSDINNVGGLHYDSTDNTMFGLSHGAYAGIFCTFLFTMCVTVLIIWHCHKRKRNDKLKNTSLEICTMEKMIPQQT